MNPSFLKQAIELAVDNVCRDGGPFGALIVKNGIVIATGVNQVTHLNDPTAHAEIVAIREACRVLGDFQLAGCDLYASCEPCPMCLGAIFWARPSGVFYAATKADAAAAGFDDALIYQQIDLPGSERQIPMLRVDDAMARAPFDEWMSQANRKKY